MLIKNLKQIPAKCKGKSFTEIILQSTCFIRGYLLSLRLADTALLSVRGKVTIINKNGLISIGDFTDLWPGIKLSCCSTTTSNKAFLQIGNYCSIGDRTEIHAGKSVTIGDNVIIAWDCIIMDRDYHSSHGKGEICQPVTIKHNVWIGCRAIILKGITIGEGAVISAGSVVTKDVDPYTMVAGNPARFIKTVAGWR